MRTLLLAATLLMAACAFGQQTPIPVHADGAKKNIDTHAHTQAAKPERDAWREEALAKVKEHMSLLRDEERALGARRAEVSSARRELEEQEKKAGMENGLEKKKELMSAAQKEVSVQEKILAGKRAELQAIRGEIYGLAEQFEKEHGFAGRRVAINHQQKELDEIQHRLSERQERLDEARRRIEHAARGHHAEYEELLLEQRK